jgi:hypothetical protein
LPALSQTNNNNNNQALADCIATADKRYSARWEATCIRAGHRGHCANFIGSPRDTEFSQLRIQELSLCAQLYGMGK